MDERWNVFRKPLQVQLPDFSSFDPDNSKCPQTFNLFLSFLQRPSASLKKQEACVGILSANLI